MATQARTLLFTISCQKLRDNKVGGAGCAFVRPIKLVIQIKSPYRAQTHLTLPQQFSFLEFFLFE